MTGRLFRLMAMLMLSLSCVSCGGPEDHLRDGKVRVFVTVPPQAYFVERIGGEHVDVSVLVAPGQEPHFFEPRPRQITALSQSELYFCVGMPFEDILISRLKDQRHLKIVDTRRGIDLMELNHDHHGHDDGNLDPHIWMSPRLAGIMARTIRDELKQADPHHADMYDANYAALASDLEELDAHLREALRGLEGRTFYVFHPAFGYFAREYNLKQKAVEDSGKSPGARQLQQLIDQAKADGVQVVFVQPQFSKISADALARELNGAVVPLDPLAKDYISNMRLITQRISEALTPAR